jgi:hypothetical protein
MIRASMPCMGKHTETKRIVAKNLKDLRVATGLSIPKISTLIKVDSKSIRRHEDGEHAHLMDTVDLYASFYGVEPWQLLIPGYGEGKPKMPLFKVAVSHGSQMETYDGVSHGGKLWIVPQWIEDTTRGIKWPARMIRFDDHPLMQERPEWLQGCEYVLSREVPQSVLAGMSSKEFETLAGSDVTFVLNTSDSFAR